MVPVLHKGVPALLAELLIAGIQQVIACLLTSGVNDLPDFGLPLLHDVPWNLAESLFACCDSQLFAFRIVTKQESPVRSARFCNRSFLE